MKPQKLIQKTGMIVLISLVRWCFDQSVMAQGNLVINGGFDTDASGWTTTNEYKFGYVSTKGNPGGYFFLYTNSSSLTPMISQTINGLIPGSNYIVSGDYEYIIGGIIGGSRFPSFGVALNSVFLFETAAPTDLDWHSFSFDYTATSTSVLLSLSSQLNGTGVSYGIDNIAMYIVPEPSTIFLISLGSGVLIYVRTRKRFNL